MVYAGRGRGPVDQTGLRWIELRGGRVRRGLAASWKLLRGNYDVGSLHDPEMLPAAIVATFLGRRVVFDVHENVPDQIRTKGWLPMLFRKPVALLVAGLLRIAERRMAITLAEEGYRSLFEHEHPVFPNYLVGQPPPPRPADPEVGVVYLGDVTEARGLALAVEATAAAGANRMTVMGRCSPDFRTELERTARRHNLDLIFHGYVTQDDALTIAAAGVLGLSPLLDLPNYRKSLPTKVLEYLAVGIPTVASDLPGTRAVVGDLPGVVLVPPGEVAAWQVAIKEAVADAELRRVAANGAAAVRDAYVWPEQAVRDFYRSQLDAE